MSPPSPAIVAQHAVRPLPRWALWLLCACYVLPGFVGRGPWKSADVAAFGYMQALAAGETSWLRPALAGLAPDTEGVLAYWIGAVMLWVAPGSWDPEFTVRLPFIALMGLTLSATWYGTYHLARAPGAQPVAFAFGGEALPVDYARTMADAAVLALIACLGLAQLSHETTNFVVQLAGATLVFYGAAALGWKRWQPWAALAAGLAALSLSGAPMQATLLGGGALWMACRHPDNAGRRPTAAVLTLVAAAGLAAGAADLWSLRLVLPGDDGKDWESLLRLLVWFGWPAWPLVLWTLWRWRHQLRAPAQHPHIVLPLWFSIVVLGGMLTKMPADRALLVGLPMLSTLAAFALPTLQRSVAALIDWFTLAFFSVSAIAIWVIWLAMQTGIPAKPAANVAKLAPGFVPSYSPLALALALAASVAWCVLVWWRASRDRTVLWKSLVLPAAGATLGWLLLLTLWLPLLDYARSYRPQMQRIAAVLSTEVDCIHVQGLSRAQLAAVRYHLQAPVVPLQAPATCDWLLADRTALPADRTWTVVAHIARPTDRNDILVVLRAVRARAQ